MKFDYCGHHVGNTKEKIKWEHHGAPILVERTKECIFEYFLGTVKHFVIYCVDFISNYQMELVSDHQILFYH
jgi:hypothetical protein